MAGSLEGRVIAVAGGAAGNLGPTVVRRLASTGSHALRRAVAIGRASTHSRSDLGDIDTDVVDLLDPVATRGWAADLAARHGRVDGLVHLVGGWRGGTPIEEAPLEDWDFLSALLVRTVQHATQALRAAPAWRAGRDASCSSPSGQAQAPTHPNAAYAAAKAASETWTLALADRFRGSGATANIVVVGAIVTPAMRAESPDKDFSTFTPAEEIAEAIAYLCSDAASSMNGQRVTLRGAA